MESFTDLNKVLPSLFARGTVEDAQRLVAASLAPDSIIEEIKKSKRYEMIESFLPLLQLGENTDRCEEFEKMFARAIADEQEEGIRQLQLHLSNYCSNNQIAFYYGQLATSPQLPIECDQDYTSHLEYQAYD